MPFQSWRRLGEIPFGGTLGAALGGGGFAGVLDGITNIAFAYSLRKLRSDYDGSAVRIRRSSDNAEQDIGFTVDGSFDGDAFNTFIGAGTGYVHTHYDQSGNGYNLVQTTAANQPVLDNSGAIPAIVFAAANSTRLRYVGDVAASASRYIVAVATHDDDINRCLYDFNFRKPQMVLNGTGGILHYEPSYNDANAGWFDTNIHVFSERADAGNTTWQERVDGTLRRSDAAFAGYSTDESGLSMGASYTSGSFGNYFNANIYELICIDALPDDDNAIGSEIAAHYGVTWNAY